MNFCIHFGQLYRLNFLDVPFEDMNQEVQETEESKGGYVCIAGSE